MPTLVKDLQNTALFTISLHLMSLGFAAYELWPNPCLPSAIKWSLLAFLLCLTLSARAQTDTIYHVYLNNHDVNDTRKWANDTVRCRYNQMKYYVTTIRPSLEEATALFNERHPRLSDPGLTG